MKRSEHYRRMAQDIASFRDAYQSVLTHMEPVREYMTGSLMAFRPKETEKAEAATASQKTSQLAGRAKRAQIQSGISRTFVVPNVGMPIDPITSWDHSLRDVEAMPPQQVVNTCDLIIGALQEKAERAEATDPTFVGRLAAMAALPARVRSIVAEDHPGLSKIGFATGVFAQIVVTVVGGLILAGATAGVAALWKGVVHNAPAPAPSPTVAPATYTPTVPTATTVPVPTSK
ncbi:hypothetical protein [Micromonospora chersina]|uniref:Uncharacterized protein n=1 Tax=Micromonospora chersina TaxID=47854 RepID=A0A1C6UR54_9ACTN|nr:hypothetical protein [Micromonospora chersina]SCL56478.1 hypothetical protein GA0070603_2216 [Micromonospora chersina]